MDIESVKEKIVSNQIISFDIFDTLVMRKVLYPENVFDLVGKQAEKENIIVPDFRNLRIRADNENPYILPEINNIYDELQEIGHIQDRAKERLMELELKIEENVLIRRESMVGLLDYAISKGKEVYLISDMYLPKQILQGFLEHLNIYGYRDIFVSCEYKKSKRDGLFTVFKEKVRGESYLHIGDNHLSDGMAAEQSGIQAVIVKSALDTLRESSYAEIMELDMGLPESCLLGLAISRLFNSPFIQLGEDKRPSITDSRDLIFGLSAPIITAFMLWFWAQVKKEKYDGVLFAARDGNLVKRMYEMSMDIMGERNVPEGIYFPTSRTLCAAAAMNNQLEISRLQKRNFSGSPQEMLQRRFMLQEQQIIPYDEEKYKTDEAYIMEHQKFIINKSIDIKDEYRNFIKRLGIQSGRRYLLFDFVSSGTCQYFLGKIIDFFIEGAYFCCYKRHDEYAEDFNRLSINAFKTDKCEDYVSGNFFLHYLWMEAIFTDHNPSIAGIADGTLRFDNDGRSKIDHENLDIMQKEILNFYQDYLSSFRLFDQLDKTDVVDRLFSFISLAYTDDQSGLFEHLHLKDDFDQNLMEAKR